jgi:hypothetical protein
MVPIPRNLPLLVGQTTGDQAEAVAKVLKGDLPLDQCLDALGRYWKIKVWFNREYDFQVLPHWVKNGDTKHWKRHERSNVHVFPCVCLSYKAFSSWSNLPDQEFQPVPGTLLYQTTRNSSYGYYFPSLNTVIKYEPVIKIRRKDEFSSYEDFARKFDRRFITESEIQKLWNGTSAQHGGKYVPSDFKRIGPAGRKVLNQFLQLFADVNTEGKCYSLRSNNKVLESYHHTSCQLGRDIRISHTLGQGKVYYSSEFKGYGNGRYGLLANKNEYLHLEDD